MDIPFLLVGAAARDCLMLLVYGIPATQATHDCDLAVAVRDWQQYRLLAAALTAEGRFSPAGVAHRFRHASGLQLDLVPYGGVAGAGQVLVWPDRPGTQMSTLGLAEASQASCLVRVSATPDLLVRVAPVSGLAVLKLVAWDERYPERDNDARDLRLIVHNYADCGNVNELYERHLDIFDGPDIDYAGAGARLLGRHMGGLMTAPTRARVLGILDRECATGPLSRLARQMEGGLAPDDRLAEAARLLGMVLRGIQEMPTGPVV